MTFSLYPAFRMVGVQVVCSIALKFGFCESSRAQRAFSPGSSRRVAQADVFPDRVGARPAKKARVTGFNSTSKDTAPIRPRARARRSIGLFPAGIDECPAVPRATIVKSW